MKLNPKQLAASAALLGVLACAAALPASAAGPCLLYTSDAADE